MPYGKRSTDLTYIHYEIVRMFFRHPLTSKHPENSFPTPTFDLRSKPKPPFLLKVGKRDPKRNREDLFLFLSLSLSLYLSIYPSISLAEGFYRGR